MVNVILTGLGTHGILLKHDHSTFQHEQIRCDLTVCNSIVTLKALFSFGGTIFKDYIASFNPLTLTHGTNLLLNITGWYNVNPFYNSHDVCSISP